MSNLMTKSPAILEARNLTRTYATASGPLTVLQSVTFAIPAGATAAIVGPSGSGKTTLLGLCAGLDKPSSGEILLEGKELGACPRTNAPRCAISAWDSCSRISN